jgi:cysteine-rich repeat protein
MRTIKLTTAALACAGLTACVGDSTSQQAINTQNAGILRGQLSGAIFTTLVDGSRVDANIYEAKTDVYLDGGPGNNAPVHAAALPEGDYYFMVTDPSGMALLSSDPIECRAFHVSADGVIVSVIRASVGGNACQHATGIDQDHADLGAITVQLMPYDDTPNPGGEYKAWATPVAAYDASAGVHGFIHRYSKTDNFKVLAKEVPPPPVCGNGVMEGDEACDDGNTTDGDGCSSTCTIETPPPPPAPCCGDGHLDAGEECDDGNTVSGDGCSADCHLEEAPPGCGGACP